MTQQVITRALSPGTLVIMPGSGSYLCRVLGVRFPNVLFILTDPMDNRIQVRAKYKGFVDKRTLSQIADAIAVLEIVYQLTRGGIAEVIHG